MASIVLKDKRALITGASGGIGAAVGKALAERGVRLVLSGRKISALEAVRDACAEAKAEASVVPADLTDPAAPEALIRAAVESLGGLDFLINSAGIAEAAPFADTGIDDWERHMAINARAPFFLCQQAVPYLEASESAAVVNVASVVAEKGYPYQAAYGASKHALLGFTKAIAKELQKSGIRMYTVSPGGVATEMVTSVRPDIDTGDLIQPEEVADVVVFLLSQRGNAMIDEIKIRRDSKDAWL